MAVDVAALGISVDATEVHAATAELNTFADVSDRVERSTNRLTDTWRRNTGEARNIQQTSRYVNQQTINLGYQLNDIATGLLSGQSPFAIMAQQGGQVAQIMATTPGGLVGLTANLGNRLAGLLTPLTAVSTGIALMGGSALMMANNWAHAQNQIGISLSGIGRMSGTTLQDINNISDTLSKSQNISVGAARDFALAMAGTGRISAENIALIGSRFKDFQTTLQLDSKQTSDFLTKAFGGDLTDGIDVLNTKFVALDGTMQKNIRDMLVAGDRQGAIRAMFQAVSRELVETTTYTSRLNQEWNELMSTLSRGANRVGAVLNTPIGQAPSLTGNQGPRSRITGLQAQQDELAAARDSRVAAGVPEDKAEQSYQRRLNEIQNQINKEYELLNVEKERENTAKATDAANAVRPIVPGQKELDNAKEQARLLSDVTRSDDAKGRTERLEFLYLQQERVNNQLKDYQKGLAANIDPLQKNVALEEERAQAIDRPGPQGQAAAARRATQIQFEGTQRGPAEEKAIADARAYVASGGIQGQIALERQRIATLGQFATVEDTVRAKQLEINLARMHEVQITKEQENQLLSLARVQAQNAKIELDARFAVQNSMEQYKNKVAELDVIAKQRNFTEQQYADALRVVAKEQEDVARAAAVRRAPFTNLKQFELDAANLRGSLDTLTTTSLNNVNTALIDIETGAKKAKDGFKDMGTQIMRSVLDMANKMLILGPIAKALQSSLGALLPGGGTLPTMAQGGYGPDIPTSIPHAAGGTIPAGMYGIAGEAGPEFVRGPANIQPMWQMTPPGSAGNNINVKIIEAPGTKTTAQDDGNGGLVIETIHRGFEGRTAENVSLGRGALSHALKADRSNARLFG